MPVATTILDRRPCVYQTFVVFVAPSVHLMSGDGRRKSRGEHEAFKRPVSDSSEIPREPIKMLVGVCISS